MRTSPFLSYDLEKQIHRSAKDEWQPHQTQSDKSFEWWYFTALVHDTAGTSYFLFWDIVSYAGKRYLEQMPQWAAQIKPGQALFSCLFSLSNYTTAIHRAVDGRRNALGAQITHMAPLALTARVVEKAMRPRQQEVSPEREKSPLPIDLPSFPTL